nr:unnamed protein product [Callosobruchus chinensis]
MDDKYMVKVSFYRHIFETKFNLAFGFPKSDTCSVCDAGEKSLELKKNYEFAFNAEKLDRTKPTIDKKICYLTMDLQQTIPLPHLHRRHFIYGKCACIILASIPLPTLNTSHFFFTWTEDTENRGSNEIGDVTIGDIQSKFQALKQNAQRERRKCLESHRSGAGTDEIVEPSLWYFKLIEFIFDEDQPRPAVDSLSLHENEEEMNDVERITATVSQEGLLIVDEVIQTPGSSASE